MSLVALVIWYFLFWQVNPWILARLARRGIPQPDGPYTLTFSEEGVQLTTPAARFEWTWALFLRARETAGFILLYFCNRQPLLIPRSALLAGDRAALLSLLTQRLGGRVSFQQEAG
jgi:hypothetical protein